VPIRRRPGRPASAVGAQMHFSITYERGDEDPKSGPVTVGWLLTEPKAGVIYEPPERLSTGAANRRHGKSAGRCPGILMMESRYFVVKCPFDVHLGFGRDKAGKPVLINRAGAASSIRASKLNEKFSLTNEAEWRFPDRPTIQMSLPYLFVADEPVFITQVAAFAHYRKIPLPGTIFGGRFPIDVWPRPLMWAFEWHEPEKDIVLKRGEPLFYCQFECDHPERAIQMVEAEMTEALQAYLDHISGAVNYVNQTFSLFRAAERVRPARLLTRRERSGRQS